MGSKTRIIILHMKEIIYTVLFILFALILIFLFIYMFFLKKQTPDNDAPSAPTYTPGVYTTSIHLGENPVNLQVTVDKDHVESIVLSPFEESVAAMYPLLSSCLDTINAQITSGVSPENVVYDEASQYTASVLLDAITLTLNKAAH